MAKTQRTDVHRPGAIIPANYEDWRYYSLPSMRDGYPMPAMHVDCAAPRATFDAKGQITGYVTPVCPDSGRCCVESVERHARRDGRPIFGSRGKCGVCGACFIHGTMFRHNLDGAMVHMGHDCADKYAMMFDLSAFEMERGRMEKAAAVQITRAKKERERADFLAKHPGLEDALKVEHRIIADIAARFVEFCTLSDKQVALVFKLADEVGNPRPAKPEEKHIPAPTGRQDFIGEIVSFKLGEDYGFGAQWKCTIKVTTEAGTWLAWGSLSASLLDTVAASVDAAERARRDAWAAEATERATRGENPGSCPCGPDRREEIRKAIIGSCVSVRATLEPGRESHFVFMKRPSMSFAVYGPTRPAPKRERKPRKTDEKTEDSATATAA